jgi:flagellar biosynthesis protein FlhG
VNLARNETEGLEVYRHLSMVTERFLNLSIRYLGFIPLDPHVQRAVRRQMAVVEVFPDCSASHSFLSLAEKIARLSVSSTPRGNINLFWQYLIQSPTVLQRERVSPQI